MDVNKKRRSEKELLNCMIHIYCRGNHGCKKVLCPECRQLEEYANIRTDKCPFMETKTFCSACKIHCYAPPMQKKIREVMKYAGPRMFFLHPVTALKHIYITLKNKKKR